LKGRVPRRRQSKAGRHINKSKHEWLPVFFGIVMWCCAAFIAKGTGWMVAIGQKVVNSTKGIVFDNRTQN
jgi:uncharacterized membrane protein